jgi:hypothetical protein
MEGDFVTDTMRYKCTSRWDVGWTNWRTVWGTPGPDFYEGTRYAAVSAALLLQRSQLPIN